MVALVLKRIAIVGAESTGTTTLAQALAEHFGAPLVPEYGREYAQRRMAAGATGDWRTHDDFLHIAARQSELEEELAASATDLLICDTTPLMVCVYEERYLGSTSPQTEAIAAEHGYALTILTAPDIPFAPDAIRDDGRREWMTARLRERARPRLEVGGLHEHRLAAAIAAMRETGEPCDS